MSSPSIGPAAPPAFEASDNSVAAHIGRLTALVQDQSKVSLQLCERLQNANEEITNLKAELARLKTKITNLETRLSDMAGGELQ